MSKSKIIILCFAITYLVWGSTYMINVLLLRELSPFFLSGTRFTFAGVLLMVYYLIATKNREKLSKAQISNAILIGFLFLTVGNGALAWSLQYLESGYAALMISTQPLIVLLMNQLFYGHKTKLFSYIGVLISIIGVVVLVSQSNIMGSNNIVWGTFALLISLLVWGWGSIYMGKGNFPKSYVLNTAIQMLVGGPILLALSYLFEDSSSLLELSRPAWAYFMYLVVLGSICTFTAFNYLLINVSPEKVVTNTYVNPIVAVLLGVFVLGESFTIYTLIGGILMLVGVYAILNVKYSMTQKQ